MRGCKTSAVLLPVHPKGLGLDVLGLLRQDIWTDSGRFLDILSHSDIARCGQGQQAATGQGNRQGHAGGPHPSRDTEKAANAANER